MIRVVDTGPILFLARLERLDLLRLGADVVLMPSVVIEEMERKPHDPVLPAVRSIVGDWAEECSVPGDPPSELWYIGPGESQVIAQATARGAQSVVLDDMDARRTARRLGLTPVGTVGLLIAATARGMVPSLRPELERLRDMGFWISQELWDQALAAAGESNAT